MILKQAILHILDKNNGNLLLSQKTLDLTQPALVEYILSLIEKIERVETKKGTLPATHTLAETLTSTAYDFVTYSQHLAEKLFQLIAPAEEIAAADYLFFEATTDHGHDLFGVIRLDYQTKFTHLVEYDDQVMHNSMMQHHTIFPASTQLPSEAWLFDRQTSTYQLREKQYIIEGKRQAYFSQRFLEIEAPLTPRQQVKELKNMISHLAKKHNEENYVALAATQQSIAQQLETSNEIDAALIFDTVFKDNPLAKEAGQLAIQEQRVAPTVKVADVPTYEKRYRKQKFTLANGIELSIPLDIYENKEMIEFINHPNGTVSVMIKNVEAITNRFNG